MRGVYDAIAMVVAKAAHNGSVIHANQEAKRIAKEHPHSQMTELEISAQIFKLALTTGLSVDAER